MALLTRSRSNWSDILLLPVSHLGSFSLWIWDLRFTGTDTSYIQQFQHGLGIILSQPATTHRNRLFSLRCPIELNGVSESLSGEAQTAIRKPQIAHRPHSTIKLSMTPV